jgi:hypothetical protein
MCTVCAKYVIGSEVTLGTPMVLLGDVSQVETRFHQFGDSINLNTR